MLDSPLDSLRSLIPQMDRAENPKYEVDPDLNLEHLDKGRWTEFYDEGIDVMTRFNRELSKAIAADGKGERPCRVNSCHRVLYTLLIQMSRQRGFKFLSPRKG